MDNKDASGRLYSRQGDDGMRTAIQNQGTSGRSASSALLEELGYFVERQSFFSRLAFQQVYCM